MIRDAVLSPDKVFRYSLSRVWAPERGCVGFGMLNPSTADHERDDPTIKRCIHFANYWGYGELVVVNAFALRATNPDDLDKTYWSPVGADNDAAIISAISKSKLFVAAWGNILGKFPDRFVAMQQLLAGIPLHHLGLTQLGHPRHPLYVKGTMKPTLWTTGGFMSNPERRTL